MSNQAGAKMKMCLF